MAESRNKTVDVNIECDGTACRVIPGAIDVENQNNVKFHNKTAGRISILFSEECLFSAENVKMQIDAGKAAGVKVQKVQRGIYPFAVYCETINDFATGSSMPIIIIKR